MLKADVVVMTGISLEAALNLLPEREPTPQHCPDGDAMQEREAQYLLQVEMQRVWRG